MQVVAAAARCKRSVLALPSCEEPKRGRFAYLATAHFPPPIIISDLLVVISAQKQNEYRRSPSLEPEPFGIVVLEGLASGCAVVASRNGGLPEAVGPHGVLFEPGNSIALADAILAADAAPELLEGVAEHLAQHEAGYVAGKYLKVLESAIADYR